MTPHELLSAILPAGSAFAAVGYMYDGRKVFAPTPIKDEADRLALIDQHLSGVTSARTCVSKAGRQWRETTHTGYGAYCLSPSGHASWICIDIDGPDHARQQTADDVQRLLLAVMHAIEARNLPYVVERSSGAKGFHVWSLFPAPETGPFANWLAESIMASAIERCPGLSLEAFPKQAKAQSLGSLVALPLPGKPKAPGGGEVLTSMNVITRCHERPLSIQRELWLAAMKLKADYDDMRKAAFDGIPEQPVPGQELNLEVLVQAIAPERVAGWDGPDMAMSCPHHQSRKGRSLQVDPVKRVWFCHACRKGGSDKWAAFSLAKWLMPIGCNNRAVTDRIYEIEEMNHVQP